MLETFVSFVLDAISGMGYTGIVILMALESSFVPFPSEVVVPPAGYLAAQGEMNIYLVVLSGIGGSVIGALFNYFLAIKMGRILILKYGKYLLMPPEKFYRVDTYFDKHGEITTFAGRLIPVIRQYISFPAGLAGMNIPKFCAYTGLGAGIWVVVLAWLGYFIGSNPELMHSRLKTITILLLICVFAVISVYIYYQRKKGNNRV
ncbi:DedA family protein [Limisalsivibrio acetivorans]|uniref:DedA family protein n=1 Tax=Limisalsivibrio acetivorans TaxID=1304888 RepID=UPI0003B58343|nr:DedA family protein [Limisalsivibrio acetivorans]